MYVYFHVQGIIKGKLSSPDDFVYKYSLILAGLLEKYSVLDLLNYFPY